MLLILAVWKSLAAACFSMEGFGVFLWLQLWILIQSIQHLSSAVKFQQRWSFGVIRRENALKDARVSVERLWNSLCLEPLVSKGNEGFLHDFLTKPYFCFMSFTQTNLSEIVRIFSKTLLARKMLTCKDPLEPDQKQFPGLATVNLIKIANGGCFVRQHGWLDLTHMLWAGSTPRHMNSTGTAKSCWLMVILES